MKEKIISKEAKICINRISLYEDYLTKKENILEELKKYNLEKQYKIIKEVVDEERKYVKYLVTRKNIFMKEEKYEQVQNERKHIKEISKFIEWCLDYKNSLIKEKVVKKEENKELTLDISDIELQKIDVLNSQNNLELLESFLKKNPLERHEEVINARKEYIKLYSSQKEKIEVLKEAKNLRIEIKRKVDDLDGKIKNAKDNVAILNKINLFLNRILSIDAKVLSKEDSKKVKEKEKKAKQEKNSNSILKEINLSNDELIFTYKELLFKTKNIIFIRKLMEEFPNIYTLKDGKNHYIFDTILEQYTNILLNKNYILEETEKQKLKKEETLKEIEYYENIILEYIVFAKEKRLDFVEGSITKRVDQVINMIENNEIYLKKGKYILEHLNFIVETLNISGLAEIDTSNTKPVDDEFIFSIDGDETKTKENAMSIKVVDNKYHLNIYITDISGFIIHNSKFMTRAKNKLLYNNEDDRIFSKQIRSMFSLNQGRSKNVLGYHLIMDENLNVIDFKIEKNIVKLNRNFKESEVNTILEDDLIQKGSDDIKLLYEILLKEINNREVKNKAQYIITLITRILSKKLGEYCYLQRINCLYSINGINNYATLDSKELTVDNAYVKFSAPLRNYASLVNQLVILGYEKAKKEIDNTYLLLSKEPKINDEEIDDKVKTKK